MLPKISSKRCLAVLTSALTSLRSCRTSTRRSPIWKKRIAHHSWFRRTQITLVQAYLSPNQAKAIADRSRVYVCLQISGREPAKRRRAMVDTENCSVSPAGEIERQIGLRDRVSASRVGRSKRALEMVQKSQRSSKLQSR